MAANWEVDHYYKITHVDDAVWVLDLFEFQNKTYLLGRSAKAAMDNYTYLLAIDGEVNIDPTDWEEITQNEWLALRDQL